MMLSWAVLEAEHSHQLTHQKIENEEAEESPTEDCSANQQESENNKSLCLKPPKFKTFRLGFGTRQQAKSSDVTVKEN